MEQKDKDLLLKDLCGRLSFGVKFNHTKHNTIVGKELSFDFKLKGCSVNTFGEYVVNSTFGIEHIKPYLRPMPSMTEEEVREFYDVEHMDAQVGYIKPTCDWHFTVNGVDWLNAHHFDYRGLIEKDLAIEAPEGIYKEE